MSLTDIAQPPADRPPPDDGPLSDRRLLERFQKGDREAAGLLYARYADRLRALTRRKSSSALACRLDPDDIVQSVFRNFFHAAREGGYDVPPGEDLWKLLLVIALNKIRARGTFHRAAKRDVRRTRRIDGLDPYTLAKENQHGQSATTFLRLAAEEALAQLPPLQRRIVELRMQGYQVHEIAGLTGRSLRTVERTLQHCRQQLSSFLTDHEPPPAATPSDAGSSVD
ncbi:MAG TPA: RNA polymerase sigma factor [Gemmataceae bacterium]|jgi:RNA polymerase sigma-70 factor (ECF subfamily)